MPLEFRCATTDFSKESVDLLAVGVFAGEAVTTTYPVDTLDKAMGGVLAEFIAQQEFTGKKDQTLEVDTLGRLAARRLLLVGLGEPKEISSAVYRTFAARAGRNANGAKAKSLALVLPSKIQADDARALAEGVVLGAYRFTKYLTGDRLPKAELAHATVFTSGKTDKLKSAMNLGARIAKSICITRDLVNEPPNELTPIVLASHAQQIAKQHGLDCKVFDRKALERKGMKLLLAVGQGSVNEPRLVHLTYKPAKPSKKKLVWVGKGITFDSGGICIKPAAGMGDMKSDMAGAANVIGLMACVAEIAPDVEVHGIIATAENMLDGNAYRPGDIFGSLDGKTVEIINTDAEGRLVLADALAYARALNPSVLVCNATLTGACVVALGQHCSGFFTAQEELAAKFNKAAADSGEQFWRLPLLEDMREQLKSDVADLKHTGDRWGGSISAALFLTEFVGDTPFIHCDIAGPALAEKPYSFYSKGGTGHGVLAFLRFVETF
ncbi:MAG TPA: leucyl aminopeptidase [Polyangiaceae bacterium]|jgi:leucyl aminopeptidase|nr:MAG: Cytosol aminopeptidase [Deltaproteobacteria bacterium ADurb.Bin207]HNS96358.1 leucyl aminopeptidase [Polyangiaceae bacterium]HNZ22926.1 leucyl aminopeptidase [Polyangiaceae bacterium]HOD21243.1 leucyl aminopeptidase [Polyangiaceae bacterium]HOE49888.1 leucyl aminopeptidase [Polyangiaceae bacterium]